jgi:Macrocin-O-methyltransferase (TylF)
MNPHRKHDQEHIKDMAIRFITVLLLAVICVGFVIRISQTDLNAFSTISGTRTTTRITISSKLTAKVAISCPAYDFPERTQDEIQSINMKWEEALDYVSRSKLSFIRRPSLEMHRDLIHDIESNQIPGMLLECGVAKGGSSVLFSVVKNPERCLHLFDTFQGIPPPSKFDGADVHKRYKDIQDGKAGENYYGYMKDLLGFVQDNINKAGNNQSVSLHKGLFNGTVWPVGPVAFLHLDGDWYESTYGMLERVQPLLSVGGYIVVDDALTWSGAREAVSDFFNIDVQQFAKLKRTEEDRPKCLAQNNGNFYALELWSKVFVKKLDPAQQSGLNPCNNSLSKAFSNRSVFNLP